MSMKVQSLGAVGSAAEGLTCSGSTNATPIVLTIAPSTLHRLNIGDRVGVAGITGNTAANGDWTLSTIAATTTTLEGSAGNGTHGGTPVLRVLCDRTPFLQRHSALCLLTEALTGTAAVEGSDDNVTANFATALKTGALALGANPATLGVEVILTRYMRLNCSSYSSGALRASLVA